MRVAGVVTRQPAVDLAPDIRRVCEPFAVDRLQHARLDLTLQEGRRGHDDVISGGAGEKGASTMLGSLGNWFSGSRKEAGGSGAETHSQKDGPEPTKK